MSAGEDLPWFTDEVLKTGHALLVEKFAEHPEVQKAVEKYENQIVWAYRHFPLEAIHPSARPLAEGSECAAQLGGDDKFWEYIDYVFQG